MRIAERITDLGFAAGWGLVRRMPEGLADGLFRFVADRAAAGSGKGAQQLRRNLARVVPRADDAELDELVRASMRSYARYWKEAFRLPAMDAEAIYREVDRSITGTENLDAALAEGNGVVVALTHAGNWDAAGIWLVHHSGQFTTVVERLRPESVFQRFVAYRESLGFEVLPLTGGDRVPHRVLLERLRDNRVVCLVADRDLSATGLPVTFFGEKSRMPAGPAKLSAATGAALLPIGSWYTEEGWGFRIHPPIRVAGRDGVLAATQAMADVFAGDIAAHPADWHMLQKLWLADLPTNRRRALATTGAGQDDG